MQGKIPNHLQVCEVSVTELNIFLLYLMHKRAATK